MHLLVSYLHSSIVLSLAWSSLLLMCCLAKLDAKNAAKGPGELCSWAPCCFRGDLRAPTGCKKASHREHVYEKDRVSFGSDLEGESWSVQGVQLLFLSVSVSFGSGEMAYSGSAGVKNFGVVANTQMELYWQPMLSPTKMKWMPSGPAMSDFRALPNHAERLSSTAAADWSVARMSANTIPSKVAREHYGQVPNQLPKWNAKQRKTSSAELKPDVWLKSVESVAIFPTSHLNTLWAVHMLQGCPTRLKMYVMARWLQRCGQSISRTNYIQYPGLFCIAAFDGFGTGQFGALGFSWKSMTPFPASCFMSEQHTGLASPHTDGTMNKFIGTTNKVWLRIWQRFCFLQFAGTPWGDCQTLAAFPRDWRETASPWALVVIRRDIPGYHRLQRMGSWEGWGGDAQTLFALCVICWFSKEHQIHVSLLTMEQKWTQNEAQHRSLESRLENLEGQLRVQSVASKSTPGSPESIAMAFLKEAEKNWAEFLVFLTFLFPFLAHLFDGFKLFFLGAGACCSQLCIYIYIHIILHIYIYIIRYI